MGGITCFMFAANSSPVNPRFPTPEEAKAVLRQKNWSYRRAAAVLGVSYQHLCLVLNGLRVGTRLIPRIINLGECPTAYRRRRSA